MSFFKEVFGFKNLIADVRTTVVSMITASAVLILGPIATAIWRSVKSQTVPWLVLVLITLLGIVLLAVAIGKFLKLPKAEKNNNGLKKPASQSFLQSADPAAIVTDSPIELLKPIEIRDALDGFIRDGERLLERWDSRNDAITASEIEHQTLQWLTAVTAFVKRNLDVRHVDQLSQYQMTVEATDRWKFSFNLANRGIDITVHRISYELGYKLQILRYFRNEIR